MLSAEGAGLEPEPATRPVATILTRASRLATSTLRADRVHRSRCQARCAHGAVLDFECGEQRVSLTTLGVEGLARSRAFYEGLGWTSGAAPADDVVFFQVGGMVLALWDRGKLAEDSAVSDSPGWGGVTLAHNVRSPEEVDQVIEQARAAGGTIGREPGDTFYGGYSGIFIDPDGHPWEVAHNPHWRIDDDGSVQLNP